MNLAVKNLSYQYVGSKKLILNQINFEIDHGSYWTLVGPNGSGKSTFLKLSCRLLSMLGMQGSILWDNRPIENFKPNELAQKIAFVPGYFSPQFAVTVVDFILQARFTRSKRWLQYSQDDRTSCARAMVEVGVESLADQLITNLSAGEKQLVLLARALAQDPEVLILDESTASLDLAYQVKVFELLAKLNKKGLTIIVVTHDLNLSAEFCPNVLWFAKGQVLAQGTMQDTLTNDLIEEIYQVDQRVRVGKNPLSQRPKLFFT